MLQNNPNLIIMDKGFLIFIVGNSGSGKDAIVQALIQSWPSSYPPLRIAQRYITRPPHTSEPFISVTPDVFQSLQKQGKFIFSWHIYDLDYGIPYDVFDFVNRGEIVIVNVSRTILNDAKKRYPQIKIVFVKVPLSITTERMKTRQRENPSDPQFQERLERARENQDLDDVDCVVDNSGNLDYAVQQVNDYLVGLICNH